MGKGSPPPYSPTAPPAPGFIMPSEPQPTVITVERQAAPQVVVLGGGCPSCRVGVVRTSHITFCGIFWSIVLFPIGLLCLLCCTKDRCSNCSYTK